MLLVREAGGYVTDVAGGADACSRPGSIVAGNQAIHRALLQTLEALAPTPGLRTPSAA